MIERIHLLIYTPTYDNLLRPETVASIVGQQTRHFMTWEIGRCNPFPGRDMRNVLTQYNYARELTLRGPYDALLTVEHDMILPPDAVERLTGTPAGVVYGTYLLRHGLPTLNAWRYEGSQGLGMSLDRYPEELARMMRLGCGQVSGVGFGCTLIRRRVLEEIPFRDDGNGHAPDMPFALDCLRHEILQLARFDVRCGHIEKGAILEIDERQGPTRKVKVVQAVNILLNGSGVSLYEGQELELAIDQAAQLADLGYVVASMDTSTAEETQQLPAAPAVPKRSKR